MTKVTNKSVFIPEGATAASAIAASSQIWTKTVAGGSVLMHTNDAGVDHNINGIARSADFSTATGTTVAVSGIPLGVEGIDICFEGVSTDGSGEMLIQLGTASGLETTGYRSRSVDDQGNDDGRTTHMIITYQVAAGNQLDGICSMRLKDSSNNTWVWSGSWARSGTVGMNFFAGFKSLGGALTRFDMTNTAGNTWDGGDLVLYYS
tara:strand:+ start:787 stop:1404 length:618 start_codon:yes stop_codon:yes gene_type:complete